MGTLKSIDSLIDVCFENDIEYREVGKLVFVIFPNREAENTFTQFMNQNFPLVEADFCTFVGVSICTLRYNDFHRQTYKENVMIDVWLDGHKLFFVCKADETDKLLDMVASVNFIKAEFSRDELAAMIESRLIWKSMTNRPVGFYLG